MKPYAKKAMITRRSLSALLAACALVACSGGGSGSVGVADQLADDAGAASDEGHVVEMAPNTESLGSPLTVACLGDSITFGYGVTSRELAWPALLEALLPEGSRVTNLGVSGATLTSELPASYEAAGSVEQGIELAPDVFTLMLGTNDAANPAFSASQYEAELRELVQRLLAEVPGCSVLLMVPPPVFDVGGGFFGASLDTVLGTEVAPAVQRVADDLGCPCLNLRALCDGHSDWFPDGVHPNEAGNEAIAQAAYEALTTA